MPDGCQHPQSCSPPGCGPGGGCRNAWPHPSPGTDCGIGVRLGCARQLPALWPPLHQGPERGWRVGGCQAAGRGAGLAQDMGMQSGGWMQDQPLGLAPIRAGLWFDLGTEGRWQCHPAREGGRGAGTSTTGGHRSGVFAEVMGRDTVGHPTGATRLGMVSASGVGMGQTGWQGHPQPGAMGPSRRGRVWSLVGVWSPWGLVPGVPCPCEGSGPQGVRSPLSPCLCPIPHNAICSLD